MVRTIDTHGMKIAFRSSAAEGRCTKNATKMPTVKPASPIAAAASPRLARSQSLHERGDDRCQAEDQHGDVTDEDHAVRAPQVRRRACERLHVFLQDRRRKLA